MPKVLAVSLLSNNAESYFSVKGTSEKRNASIDNLEL